MRPRVARSARTLNTPWLTFIFYGLLLLMLVPIWSVGHFPSQDGPLHLYNAIIYRDYDHPDRAIFREFFIRNPELVPNWLCPHVLPILLQWLPPSTAEKLLLSVYLLAFPLALRYALAAVRPRGAGLAIAALPLVPNYFFHMGFEDFCFSLAGYFLGVGYWLRHRRDFRWKHAPLLAGFLLLLYLTHGLSTIMAMMSIAILALFQTGRAPWQEIVREGRLNRELGHLLRGHMPLIVSMLPAGVLILSFIGVHHGSALPWDPWPKGYFHRFYYLLSWMKAFQYVDLIPAAIYAAALLAATVWVVNWRRRSARHRHLRTMRSLLPLGKLAGLGVFAAVVMIMFLGMTDSAAGGSMLLVRLPAFIAFAALLWLAGQPLGSNTFRSLQLRVCSVSGGVLVLMLCSQMHEYQVLNRYLREFDALASLIEPGSTIAPVRFNNSQTVDVADGSHQRAVAKGIDPFQHAAAIGMAEKGIIDIGNHWATTDHHSLRWREQYTPPLEPDQDTPWNLIRHEQRIGRPIDYVVVWTGGIPHNALADQVISMQLKDRYRLVYTSPETGYLQLYRRVMAQSRPG